jgi:SAM-dependent methyltransferase
VDKLILGGTPLENWLNTLEKRHLAALTFPEVSRALRALSSNYIERRAKLAGGAALAGEGKRAAFALFYGPLHFMLIQRIVEALPGAADVPPLLVDLGCGTGASGAAWAAFSGIRRVIGIDRNTWALGEAAFTYRHFGLTAKTERADLASAALPDPGDGGPRIRQSGRGPWTRQSPAAFLAAFSLNELPDAGRDALLERLVARHRSNRGDRVLVVEPLAGFVARWWGRWRDAFQAAGGRADEWRFRVELPPIVAKLDRAAGLDHRELTGRTLWLCPSTTGDFPTND